MGSIQDTWATEPIAIVGMSAKFAGDAADTETLWKMLLEGRSGWTPFPKERFHAEGVYHPNSEKLNTTHVKGAHFLNEDVGMFDAAFFGFSGETAASMDPQYRLQLESVFEALESGGLSLSEIAGSNTSVFTGVFVHDYRDGLLRDPDNLPRLMATGTGVPMMSNRISHFFDLRGASMTIETACSSGMTALHQAVQSLRTGEAEMAIVGGANLMLNPDMFKALASAGFLSADGKSYAFDSRASGYGRGEGVATLVIKRLGDALAAGDPIRAIIRESLLNQDGKTETITSPSLQAQQDLIRACYRKAGLDLGNTQYFEAHGTGTQAGDTIEARAIATVFATSPDPLLIGSVKTNIGHTEAASGLGSIIKAALAMERGVIPPSINFEKANPKLALDKWNLRLVRQLEPWPTVQVKRASINNFGYGGSNAHVILEAPKVLNEPIGATIQVKGQSKVLFLSGKDEQACQRRISSLADFLESHTDDEPHFLDSLVYTLGQRRTRFPWTAAHSVPVTEGLSAIVQALRSPRFQPVRSVKTPRIGMVFTGQGAQWHAMGRELVDAYPVFRASLQESESQLQEFGSSWSLFEELGRDAASTRINDVAISTPACVALQIALVRLLRSWNVVPSAVVSHSSGEIAAAFAAGLDSRTAMAFAYYRAVVAAEAAETNRTCKGPAGGMVAMGLGPEETQTYVDRLTTGQAVVACINSPSSTTVSGDLEAVLELEALATADGVFARRLKVDTAWHSHHMAPIACVYNDVLERKNMKSPQGLPMGVAFSSPVTGGRITRLDDLARPAHWVDSLVQPVQFPAAFTDMVLGESGPNIDVLIEVGPHTALGGPIQQILALPAFSGLQIPYYGTLVRKTSACDTMQALAASLSQHGCPIDLQGVNFATSRSASVRVLTDLPAYPWNHQVKHWVEPRLNRALRARSQPPHDLLGSLVEGCNPSVPAWRHMLRITESPWTRDHAIQANVVYPAAGYICLAIEAVRQTMAMTTTEQTITGYRFRRVDFLQALMIPDNSEGIEIQTLLRPVHDEWHFEVWSITLDNRWTQHASGFVSATLEVDGDRPSLQDLTGYTRRVLPVDLFARLRALGIAHGPLFQNMKTIVRSADLLKSVATMAVADLATDVLHPVTLDSIITAPYSALPGAAVHETAAKVPRSVESIWVSSAISHRPGHLLRVQSLLTRNTSAGMAADVLVADDMTHKTVLEMKQFTYQSLGQNLSRASKESWEAEWFSKVEWSMDITAASPEQLANTDLVGLIRHIVHKNPRARFLEIGASSAAQTKDILQALGTSETGGPHAALYHCTGLSEADQEVARESLAPWADLVSFGQGQGPYDVVVTRDKSLLDVGYVRSLLAPGGMLLATGDVLDAGAEVDLESAGFERVKMPRCSAGAYVIKTYPERASPPADLVLVTSQGGPPADWLESVKSVIGSPVQELDLASAASAVYTDKIVVFLAELNSPLLYDLDAASLEVIRALSTTCRGLLWVTRGGAVDCARPELSLASGFVRTLRTEYVGRRLLTLDLNPQGLQWSDAGATAIAKVLQEGFAASEQPVDLEYAERNGVLMVPRIYHDVVRDKVLVKDEETETTEELFHQDRVLSFQPDQLAWGDTDTAVLSPQSIEIEPRAYGTLHAGGDKYASECAGIVVRVGSEAASRGGYTVGDHVMCVLPASSSSFASRVVVDWTCTAKMPTGMDFTEAASVPSVFLTAYYALVEVARLQSGQSVLVCDAGEIGQAAVMIAKHLGAEVYATADGEKSLTKHGMDVVLGNSHVHDSSLVAPLGHWIDIKGEDLLADTGSLAHGISFMSVNLSDLLVHRPTLVHRCLQEVVRLLEAKHLTPIQPAIFPARILADPHWSNSGRVVLSVASDETVPVLPPTTPPVTLSADASYLIVGGSGGLARAVAHWMVAHGARNLVLLSRSAATSTKTAALAVALHEAGCQRVLPVNCDVASADDLAKALDTCAREGLPAIQGVVHAAFVLRDALVENMTLADWHTTVQSKVSGAWNLHNHFNLPGDLDFFVLFSSINGLLGYPSQAAYASAGAYEDALARWRVVHCGLPAVSVDLSVVKGVGYVADAATSESAENTLQRALVKAGRRVIDEDLVLTALESAVRDPMDPQFVVGGISSGPGDHWEEGGDLGRDLRALPLRYRPAGTKDDESGGDEDDSLAARLGACATREAATRVVGAALAALLADMFLVPVEDVDLGQSPGQQGVDSLVAVEVRNMLFRQAGAELSIFNIMQSASLEQLAGDVVDRSVHVEVK